MAGIDTMDAKAERKNQEGIHVDAESKVQTIKCESEDRVNFSAETAREKASTAKDEGNALFSAKDFENAVTKYTEAVNYLKKSGVSLSRADEKEKENDKVLSVLYANRSAAYIGMKRWIPACRDGLLSAECDETNWKAYWRQGRSLLSMTPKKFRTVKAIESLEKCLECENLPEKQIQTVRAELHKAKLKLDIQEQETPLPENCTIQ